MSPEIPPNTGSIARLCAATRTRLHLIRPLGFSLDDRYLKRAGLDYWPYVDLRVHDSWDTFEQEHRPLPMLFFSARARKNFLDAPYTRGSCLVFGSETTGLPRSLLSTNAPRTYRIPIFSEQVRSLNLSNAVGIVVYEALRGFGQLAE